MKEFLKRAYTVMEIRTGFATGLPTLVWFFISGFSFNIVANVANEIRGYLKKEENESTMTGHKGSEGLVRGDATLKDALIVLVGFLALGGISGLMVVLLTKSLFILGMGLLQTILQIMKKIKVQE